jgi:hypothetical protein
VTVRWVPDPEGEFTWTESDGSPMGLYRDDRGYVSAFVADDMTPHQRYVRVKPAHWFSPITEDPTIPDPELLL